MLIPRTSRTRELPGELPAGLERRDRSRIHTVLRVATVARLHDVGLWRVRNISDGGMMLATSVPVTPGERLSVALSDRLALDAAAVWWDGERCGVAFDRPIDCAALLHELVAAQRRPFYRPPRLPVSTRAIVYCEKGLHSVRLRNLSQHGAGFSHDGRLTPGMRAKLLFEDGDEHRGVVRWSHDGRAGMYLVEPFPCARLESACRL
jgi:PilZ domain-containing protein